MKASFTQAMLPQFNNIEPTAILPTIKHILDTNRATLKNLLAQSPPFTWDNLQKPLEEMNDHLNKTWSPISHLHAVLQSEALRAAYNETLPHLTAYATELSQNEALFNAITALAQSKSYAALDSAQKKVIENDLRDFKLSGIHLSQEKKARLAELEKEMSELTTTFSEHLLDATQAFVLHVTDPKKVQGLPPQALQLACDKAQQRNLPGYVFTLDFPSYSTAIKFLDDRELRKTLYEAYVTRASDCGPNANQWDNTPVIADILRVRHEIANLVGFNNFAEYSLATKMAKSPSMVIDFLNGLLAKSIPIAKAECAELTQLAHSKDQLDALMAWDVAYYSEKLQEKKFQFTQEDFRAYFPINQALHGLFTLVNKLYGITIQEQNNIEVWHPDVRFFAIYDENQVLRGGVYTDLYARLNKRDGAWMDDCRTRRKSEHTIQYPVAYLTCNFMPPVNQQPALLTHDDVLTLFHEFGHCLHHVLTLVDYPPVAGISGVAWDAVEFPSQFLENFCWEKEMLALIGKHYQTGQAFPDELYQKMLAAKHFQTGLQMVRQIEFALFDFRLHLEYDRNYAKRQCTTNQAQALLDEIRQTTTFFPVPAFNRFQNSFSHIFAGGYAAGYYSYKWAEVLSADAYAKFEEQGIFDAATGRSFLHNILEVGGSREPMESFIAFRGREPQLDALLKHSGMLSKNGQAGSQ